VRNANPFTFTYCYTNSDSYRYSNSYGYANSDAYFDTQTNPDAKRYAFAKAATDPAASAVSG
jgi:hypothetical protein